MSDAPALKKRRGIFGTMRRVPRTVYVLAAMVLAVIFPVLQVMGIMQTLWLRIGVLALLFVLLTLGLNMIMGETGLLNLGYVAFYAVGGYTTAILSSPAIGLHLPFFVLIPLSIGAAMLAGLLIGIPTLRLRGDYLAIVTLAFGEIVRNTFNNWQAVAGGPNGVPGIYGPQMFGHVASSPLDFYYIVLIAVVLVTVLLTNLKNSRIGRAWNALREDEIAADHAGIAGTRMKMLALVLSAGVAGLAGSLYAYYQAFVNPTSFDFLQSVTVVCMVVLGGMGSIPGAILGAVVLTALPEAIRVAFTDWLPSLFGPGFMASWPAPVQTFFTDFDRYRMLLFGVVIVLVVIFRPEGLLPDVLWRRETHEEDPREAEHTRQALFDVESGRQDLEA